ncbi:MAG: deoxyribonuclease IV [Candidatus Limnocylindrales bacterium]
MTPNERRLAVLAGRRIGPHLPLKAGLVKAAARVDTVGATAIQVFTDNPTAWRRKPEPPAGMDAFRARLAALDVGPIVIHASYLINLCGSDEAFWQQSIDTVAAELRMGERYGASLVNVHIGSHKGHERQEGISQLARGLRAVFDQVEPSVTMPHLALENSAGTGDGIGSRLEDLADILAAAAAAGVPAERLGFCLDTAHLWGAGYAINDPDILDEVLERFDELVGPERLRMLHLNDSKAPLGSKRDRHEHIGAGEIGEIGMRNVLTHPRLDRVPAFLETPGMDTGYDKRNMDRVRRIIAGKPLSRLPKAAFALRSSRSRSTPVHDDEEATSE